MKTDARPWWMTPPQYRDEPEIGTARAEEDDTPIDYSKGPDRGQIFGDDLDDGPEPEEGVGS